MLVMIDAGHGGADPGAVSGRHQEKEYALGIALKLSTYLKKQGIQVFLTRTGDTYPTINERANMANKIGADYFVSIHLNSAKATASGIETLVYGQGGKAFPLAQAVQQELITATSARNRGVKIRTDLGVLKLTSMPAILVETGFISHPSEVLRLGSNTYQQTVAEAIGKGICKYAGIKLEGDKIMTSVSNAKEAVEKLQRLGVIGSPDYWLTACTVVKHLEDFFVKVANKL